MAIDVERLYDRRADNRWDRVSVGDVFERLTWSQPDRVAIVASPCAMRDPGFARVTYAEADRFANRVANALLREPHRRGDRVALFCDNSVEAFLVKIGIAKAGLVALPINTMMAPDMVEHSLRHTGAKTAIVDAEAWPKARIPFEAAGVRVLATLPDAPGTTNGMKTLRAFIDGLPDTEPDVRIHGDDIWEILMTSGTTSMPKAVMISHASTTLAAMNQALAWSRGVGFASDVRMCTFLPAIYHIGDGIFGLAPIFAGGSLVLGRVPQAANVAETVTRERPTTLFGGSPQFLADLVRAVEARTDALDLGSLRSIVYGWGAVPPDLAARLGRLCGDASLLGIFGQTECIALHHFPIPRHRDVHARTAPATNVVGLPTPLLASTVADADGNRVPPGVPGEAVYRSPVTTAGYFRDEAATRKAFEHGWFHSGDCCEVRDDGLRVMVDRYKDVVKSGGENVSSLRVEAIVAQYPGVARVAVVGLPDERWGETVTAVVVPAPNANIDTAALTAFCRERLAGYETPKRVVLVDDLPVTVGGKVLKYRLRAALAGSD